jgi:hypothetical protein
MTYHTKIAMTTTGMYLLYGGKITFTLSNLMRAEWIFRSPIGGYRWGSISLPVRPNQVLIGSRLTRVSRLLGFSAFVGFFVLVVGWPLNSYLARRSIRIQKGLLAARDKRMGVVSELIGAVRSIECFAIGELIATPFR